MVSVFGALVLESDWLGSFPNSSTTGLCDFGQVAKPLSPCLSFLICEIVVIMVSTSKRYLKSKWKKFCIYAHKAREFRKYRYVKRIKPCNLHHINILVDKPASLFPCGCAYKYNPNKCKPLMQFWVQQAKLIFKKSNSLLPLLQNHEGVQIHFHTKFSQLSSSVPFPHTLMLFYIP